MPLDGHSYLVSQGWGGKGTALRDGAISRPITVAQKKNLAGLGKDRDEAFPFWDHLFSAAAKSIQIKYISDDEDGSDSSTTAAVTLKRTSTGILSTRRPVEGTPAASGSTTPCTDNEPPPESRLSLVAHAKREAAKRGLYSRFFRGPIIGPEAIEAEEKRLAALVSEAFDKQNAHVEKMSITEHIEVETEDHGRMVVDLEVTNSVKHKKRSHTGKEREKVLESDESDDDEKEKRARKMRRKEEKRRKAEADVAAGSATEHKDKKHTSRSKSQSKDGIKATTISPGPFTVSLEVREDNRTASKIKDKKHKPKSKSKSDATTSTVSPDIEIITPDDGPSTPSVGEKAKESKEERARRKDEKRRLKALRKAELVAGTEDVEPSTHKADDLHSSKSSKRKKSAKSSWKPEAVDAVEISEEPKRRKKRKRTED